LAIWWVPSLPDSYLRQAVGLAGWLLLCAAAAAGGGFASANAGEFYQLLVRPSWAPPAWVFGPVWTVLYALMAIAAWLVWRTRGFRGAALALGLFVTQLVVNALWTWLFFTWRQGALAFVEIILLWMLIVATIVAFSCFSRIAAVLLLPYIAWVSLACALTYSTWQMNPGVLG
jgi:benzodiazapine receptor